MKKIWILALLVIFVLTACHSSTLSFSEIENVPHNVQDKIDSSLTLQSINDRNKGYYIVFHSSGDVEAGVETQGNMVTIKFKETNEQDDMVKQHLFYLTMDPEHDTIDVLLNGESIPFDNMTIQ